MREPFKQFLRLGNVRDVEAEPEVGRALPEGSRPRPPRAQPGTREPVDRLTQADVLLAADALRRDCDVVVEPDRGLHA